MLAWLQQVISTILINTVPEDKVPLSLEGVSKITDKVGVGAAG